MLCCLPLYPAPLLNQSWATEELRVDFESTCSSTMDLESFPRGEPQSWRQMQSCSTKPSVHPSCSALSICYQAIILFHSRIILWQKTWTLGTGWFVEQPGISPNKGSWWLLQQVVSLNWVGKDFCVLNEAWLAPSTEMCLTSWGPLQELLCLPLLAVLLFIILTYHDCFKWISIFVLEKFILWLYNTEVGFSFTAVFPATF